MRGISYPVVEIFRSRQGEGYNTGMEVVFIRLGGCNLACEWCDTKWRHFSWLTLGQIMARVGELECRAVILTGGEPLLQEELGSLLQALKGASCWIGVESNGLVVAPAEWLALVDYLALSPKSGYETLYQTQKMLRRAHEVRIVVDGQIGDFCRRMRSLIVADHYFLSPCERAGSFNFSETVTLLGELNRGLNAGKWLLSVQSHKLGGFA